jgi:hypothetical protein
MIRQVSVLMPIMVFCSFVWSGTASPDLPYKPSSNDKPRKPITKRPIGGKPKHLKIRRVFIPPPSIPSPPPTPPPPIYISSPPPTISGTPQADIADGLLKLLFKPLPPPLPPPRKSHWEWLHRKSQTAPKVRERNE